MSKPAGGGTINQNLQIVPKVIVLTVLSINIKGKQNLL